MNRIFLLMIFLTFGVFFSAQAQTQSADLEVRYHTENDEYTVYLVTATNDFETTNPRGGYMSNSQITLVGDSILSNASFQNITTINPTDNQWRLNSTIESPATTPNRDYYSFGNLGGRFEQTSYPRDTTIALFKFQLTEECVDSLRLFHNDNDPDSGQPGMGGGDFQNSLVFLLTGSSYRQNINPDGIQCDFDGDGVPNLEEPTTQTDPCLPMQVRGFRGYDVERVMWADSDCDGDGVDNGTEVATNSDPFDPCDPDPNAVPNSDCLSSITVDPIKPNDVILICLDSTWTGDSTFTVESCDSTRNSSKLNGTFNILANGCIEYTAPNITTSDYDSLCINTCLSNGQCQNTKVFIPIKVTPDTIITQPVNPDDTVMVCLDTNWIVRSPVNITDCDNNTSGTANPIGGNYTIDSDGCVTYTPPANNTVAGTDTVCAIVCDGYGTCDTTQIVFPVKVTPPAIVQPPVNPEDTAFVCIDTSWVTASPAAISDCDGNQSGTANPIGGTYTLDADGCVTYVAPAAPAQSGLDTVCVIVCDANSVCDTTRIVFPVTITPPVIVNPPVGPSEVFKNCFDTTWVEDGPVAVTDCDGNDSGTAYPLGGTYTFDDDKCLVYTAPSEVETAGNDTVCVTICDINDICDTIHVVYPVTKNPPVIVNPPVDPTDTVYNCIDTTWVEHNPASITDCDGNLTGTAFPIGGSYTVDEDGCVTYVPPTNLTVGGNDTVCIIVCDTLNTCDTTRIVYPITVTPPTIVVPPVDPGDSVSVCLDTTWIGDNGPASITDCDGDTEGTAYPIGGTYTIDEDGCVDYIAPTNITAGGNDTICAIVCNDLNVCDTTHIVIPITNPPVIIIDPVGPGGVVTNCVDTSWVSNSPASISDCDGNDSGTAYPIGGTYSIDEEGCITYTAPAVVTQTGFDSVCVIVCDALDNCDSTFYVYPVKKDPPTIIVPPINPGDSSTYCLDTTWMEEGPATINDCDGNIAGTAYPIGGSYTIDEEGCVSYTAPAELTEAGNDTVCVVICDPNDLCDTTLVIFPITLNPPSVIVQPIKPGDSAFVCLDTSWVENSPFEISDCDGNQAGTAFPLGGTYELDEEGCVSYVAPTDLTRSGVDTVCVVMCDAENTCDTTLVVFPVIIDDTTTIAPVKPGGGITTCFDTDWITEGPVTVTDCAGNTSGVADSIGGTYFFDSNDCLVYTAPVEVEFSGIDSVCVIICDANEICDTLTVKIPVTAVTDETPIDPLKPGDSTKVCYDSDWVINGDATFSDCAGNQSGIAEPFGGRYFILDDGCISYISPNETGNSGVDSVCFVACDEAGNCDTTIYLFPVVSQVPITAGPLAQGDSEVICMDTEWVIEEANVTLCDGALSGENEDAEYSINEDGCLEYTVKDSHRGTITDEICVVVCNNRGFCDTNRVRIDLIQDTLFYDYTYQDTFEIDAFRPLPGQEDFTIEDICADSVNIVSDYRLSQGIIEVSVNSFEIKTACLVRCAAEICDTAIISFRPVNNIDDFTPIANDDEISIIKEESIEIDVLENDEINGKLNDFKIIKSPRFGEALLVPENETIEFLRLDMPCDTKDTIIYEISNNLAADSGMIVVSYDCGELEVFTGLSPNGDGINDKFIIQGIQRYESVSLEIFNRNGNSIYRNDNYTNDDAWDGTWNGGTVLPGGSYFYLLTLIDGDDFEQQSGYIFLQN